MKKFTQAKCNPWLMALLLVAVGAAIGNGVNRAAYEPPLTTSALDAPGYPDQIKELQGYVKQFPDDITARQKLAWVLLHSGQKAEAKRECLLATATLVNANSPLVVTSEIAQTSLSLPAGATASKAGE